MSDEHAEVKFAAGAFVDVDAGDLGGWEFRRTPEGVVEAGGPCPTCRGSAYGPRLVDITERVKAPPGEDVDVVCECRCGFDHGGGGDAGCGRWWIASYRAPRP